VALVVAAFAGPAGEPETFRATLGQSLFLTNGVPLRRWIAPAAGNLTDRLTRLPGPGPVAEELFLSVLTRLPTEEERNDVNDYLKARSADRAAALEELVWALATSAEFRFNH
jgi:hypothetical protein